MKKLFRIVNISLENNKRKYFIYFILLFLSVLFMILSTFLSKVLVDTLNGDINNLEEAGNDIRKSSSWRIPALLFNDIDFSGL